MKLINDIASAQSALLIIDAQRAHCDPYYPKGMGSDVTSAICGEINILANAFRRARKPVYYIYLNSFDYKEDDHKDLFWAYGGPHKIEIDQEDRIVRKINESVLSGSTRQKFLERFEEDGIKLPCITGFHIPMCVQANVMGFINIGLKPYVLEGYIGSGWTINAQKNEIALSEMRANGARFIAPFI